MLCKYLFCTFDTFHLCILSLCSLQGSQRTPSPTGFSTLRPVSSSPPMVPGVARNSSIWNQYATMRWNVAPKTGTMSKPASSSHIWAESLHQLAVQQTEPTRLVPRLQFLEKATTNKNNLESIHSNNRGFFTKNFTAEIKNLI